MTLISTCSTSAKSSPNWRIPCAFPWVLRRKAKGEDLQMTDHDHGYQRLFSHPEMIRDLLTGFVREPWTREMC